VTNIPPELKDEHYAFNVWNDDDFLRITERYISHRESLRDKAIKLGIEGYVPQSDVPPHIRNWFENPIYQLLVKPFKKDTRRLFVLSVCFSVLTFAIGVVLLAIAVYLVLTSQLSDPIAIATLILSGIAGVLAALFKSVSVIKDTATQYMKIQVSISAGMVSLDALQ
jgi:hypothetical protein